MQQVLGRVFPSAPWAYRAVRKSTLLWVFVRGALGAFGVWAPSPITSLGVVALVCLLLSIDSKVLREELFLANLGIGTVGVIRFSAGVLLLYELVSAVVGAWAS